jgi:hypothetical protein
MLGGESSMQKFVNDPINFTDDSLAGILAAHPAMLRAVSRRGIVRRTRRSTERSRSPLEAATATCRCSLATSAADSPTVRP